MQKAVHLRNGAANGRPGGFLLRLDAQVVWWDMWLAFIIKGVWPPSLTSAAELTTCQSILASLTIQTHILELDFRLFVGNLFDENACNYVSSSLYHPLFTSCFSIHKHNNKHNITKNHCTRKNNVIIFPNLMYWLWIYKIKVNLIGKYTFHSN